jgi:hypothetical protein
MTPAAGCRYPSLGASVVECVTKWLLHGGESMNFASKQSNAAAPQPEVAELVFDSARHPAVAGVRASNVQARQLLYRLGTVCVDVCMQPELGSQEVMMVGQLMDSQKPSHGIGDIPVSLLCRENPVSQNITNAVGEFCFGFRTLHGAQLVFDMSENKTLVVPVPDTEA